MRTRGAVAGFDTMLANLDQRLETATTHAQDEGFEPGRWPE
jgi:hypothetical protein